jgi:hypothetical protein
VILVTVSFADWPCSPRDRDPSIEEEPSLKKLAALLALAIVVFSALAYWQETKNRAALAAESILGQRPGGIVINAPSLQSPASPVSIPAAPPAQNAQPAGSSDSGGTCP